jgi:hypothetical protein
MDQRIKDILDGKWCCFCLDTVDAVDHSCAKVMNITPENLAKSLSTVQDIESIRALVSPTKTLRTRHYSADKLM